jgi:hypothetical protein
MRWQEAIPKPRGPLIRLAKSPHHLRFIVDTCSRDLSCVKGRVCPWKFRQGEIVETGTFTRVSSYTSPIPMLQLGHLKPFQTTIIVAKVFFLPTGQSACCAQILFGDILV